MPEFFIYLIKANIALTIFFLAYRLGLRKLTFYTLNRLFLLFGILFSATFPLVDIRSIFSRHENLAAGVAHYSPDWYALQQYLQPETFTVWTLVRYLFWAGVIAMAVRLVIQLFSLLRIHLRSTAGRLNREKVRLMHDTVNPFSFFKNIYINPSLHSSEEIQHILIHEKIHVKGWHTTDILAGELNNLFYWFNPGAWMMKTAIRENLEFITDRKILQSGVDAKTYQYNLIKVGRIPFALSLANNFNFSHIRQRIAMMNKKRSSRYHLLRYLLLLPLIAGIILVVTSSRGKGRNDNNLFSKVIKVGVLKNHENPSPSDTILPAIVFSPQTAAHHSADTSGDGNKYAKEAYQAAKEKDYDQAAALAKKALQADPGNEDAKRVLAYVKQVKEYEQKMADYHNKKNSISITSNTGGKAGIVTTSDTAKITMPEKALYIIDNKISDKHMLSQIPPGNIRSISVFKGKEAIALYGEKGKEGVIKIITLKNQKNAQKPTVTFTPVKGVKDTMPVKVHFIPSKAVKDTAISYRLATMPPARQDHPLQIRGNVLFVVNGVPKDSTVLRTISPNSISSITVLKGASAASLYGDKAKDGAVLITTHDHDLTPVITQGYPIKSDSITIELKQDSASDTQK